MKRASSPASSSSSESRSSSPTSTTSTEEVEAPEIATANLEAGSFIFRHPPLARTSRPSKSKRPRLSPGKSKATSSPLRSPSPRSKAIICKKIEQERQRLAYKFGVEAVYFNEELFDILDSNDPGKFVSVYSSPNVFLAGSVHFYYYNGRSQESRRQHSRRKNKKTEAQRANFSRVMLFAEHLSVGTTMLLAHPSVHDAWLIYCLTNKTDPELGPAENQAQAQIWMQKLSDITYRDLGHLKARADITTKEYARHTMAKIKTPTAGGARVAAGVDVELSRKPSKRERRTGVTSNLVNRPDTKPRIYVCTEASTSMDTGDFVVITANVARKMQSYFDEQGIHVTGFSEIKVQSEDVDSGDVLFGQAARFQPAQEPDRNVILESSDEDAPDRIVVEEEEYLVMDEATDNPEVVGVQVADEGPAFEPPRDDSPQITTPAQTGLRRKEFGPQSGRLSPSQLTPRSLLREQRALAKDKKRARSLSPATEFTRPRTPMPLENIPEDQVIDDLLSLHPASHDKFSDEESVRSIRQSLRRDRNLILRGGKPVEQSCILAVPNARYFVGQIRDPDCPVQECALAGNGIRASDFETQNQKMFSTISVQAARVQTPTNGPREFNVQRLPTMLHYNRRSSTNRAHFDHLMAKSQVMTEIQHFGIAFVKLVEHQENFMNQLRRKTPAWNQAFYGIVISSINNKSIMVHVGWDGQSIREVEIPIFVRNILKDPSIIKVAQNASDVMFRVGSIPGTAYTMRHFVDASNLALMAYTQPGTAFADMKCDSEFVALQLGFPVVFRPAEKMTRDVAHDHRYIAAANQWNYATNFTSWSAPMRAALVWEGAVHFELLRRMALRAAELEEMGNGADIIRVIHCLCLRMMGLENPLQNLATASQGTVRPFGSWFETDDYVDEQQQTQRHRAWPLFFAHSTSWMSLDSLFEKVQSFLSSRRWQRCFDILPLASRQRVTLMFQSHPFDINTRAFLMLYAGEGAHFPHCCSRCGDEEHLAANCHVKADDLQCRYSLCLTDGHNVAVCALLQTRCPQCFQLGHSPDQHADHTFLCLIEEFRAAFAKGRVTSRLLASTSVSQFQVDSNGNGYVIFADANPEERAAMKNKYDVGPFDPI